MHLAIIIESVNRHTRFVFSCSF